MLRIMRDKMGPWVLSIVIGAIALIFAFEGIFMRGGQQMPQSVAGTVNGDSIPYSEFKRELDRQMEMYRSLGGGQITDAQIRQMRIQERVFEQLAQRRVQLKEAERLGFMPSLEEIAQKIQEIPAFQKDGRFDKLRYKEVLQQNNYSAGSFEKMVGDDLMLERFRNHFASLYRVTDDELDREARLAQDKRSVKYVLFTPYSAIKNKKIENPEIEKFLATAEGKKQVEQKYQEGREKEFKGKTFDAVKNSVARMFIQEQQIKDARAGLEKSAEKIVPLLGESDAQDATVNAALKESGLKVMKVETYTRRAPYIPGIGEVKELMDDAFVKPVGKAKIYRTEAGVLVARVIPFSPNKKKDAAKPEDDRTTARAQIEGSRENLLQEAWLKELVTKAKIEMNRSLIGSGQPGDSGDAG